MTDCIRELGTNLGIDLSRRIRPAGYVHLYEPPEWEAVKEQLDRPDGTVATHFVSGHVLAKNMGPGIETLASVNHELVHTVEDKAIELVRDLGSISLAAHRTGVGNYRHETFKGLQEMIVEATNIDLIRNYWPDQPELTAAAAELYENVGYLPGMILFDEIMKRTFDDPKAAFKSLQWAALTRCFSELRPLTRAMGTETMRRLRAISGYEMTPIRNLAADMGLNNAVKRIDANQVVGLLDWL